MFDNSNLQRKFTKTVKINGVEMDKFPNNKIEIPKDENGKPLITQKVLQQIFGRNFFMSRVMYARKFLSESTPKKTYIDTDGVMYIGESAKMDFFSKFPKDTLLEVKPEEFAKNADELEFLFQTKGIKLQEVVENKNDKNKKIDPNDFSEFLGDFTNTTAPSEEKVKKVKKPNDVEQKSAE